MKRKRVTEARILQISNDVSEDMVSATDYELIETIRYWMKREDATANRFRAFKSKLHIEILKMLALN